MKPRAVPIRNDQHWRELRRTHIGGSECSALFGEHRYLTPFELWHRKKNNLAEPDSSDDERIFWGRCLEPAILDGVRQKTGWGIQKCHRYYSMQPALGFGGTLDAEIIGHPHGAGVLELKTVDRYEFKGWNGIPPLSYELQLMAYMGLTGRRWGVLAVLIGGNQLQLFTYQRRIATIALIEERIAQFWSSIEAGTPPAPDYQADGEVIAALYRDARPGLVVDLSDNNRLPELLGQYEAAAAPRRAWAKVAKAYRAEIIETLGEAETGVCGEWTVKAATVAGVPDRTITGDDVGEVIRGRTAYRGLHVSRRPDGAPMASSPGEPAA
jgi:predicted phage-related endonuclease